jgi:mRNA-degrading endonuclease RelE of RelBE toxin-antitoxin system
MNKIRKFLQSLNIKEREAILLVMLQIKADYGKIPGILKLAGYKNLFRIRLGNYRIILKIENKTAEIIRITKRDDQTYSNL